MKRLICILLSLLMLAFLPACANGNGDTTTPAAETEPLTPVSDEETDPYNIPSSLPDGLDFGGLTINVASSDRVWWDDEVSVEGLNGDIINDAVYNRNLAVEEMLKVKINHIKIPYAASNTSTIDAVKTSVLSGSPDYDVVYVSAYYSLSQATSNIYTDLNSIENLDLSSPCWSQNINESAAFHGSQFGATGSIALSTLRFAFVTVFNKAMFDNATIPYPYEAVRNGEWTLDYQYEILKNFYTDNNGNNVADAEDTFGWITNDYIGVDTYWLSCEIPMLGRNADGDYINVIDTGKLSDLVDKLITMFNDPHTYNVLHKTADAEQTDMGTMFAEGRGAMVILRLIECESDTIRDMIDAYGIVPIPKYNAEQQAYHTHMHDQFTMVFATTTVPESSLPAIGAFMQAMAEKSHRSVIPAYYETTLKQKYQSDSESWEMLDIAVNGITSDAGFLYGSQISSPHAKLRSIMGARNNTVTSTFKGLSKIIDRSVVNLNNSLIKVTD